MVNEGTDYVDVFIVAILWGCTNPFLRKGTYEEDEKLRLQKEQLQKEYDQQQQQHQFQKQHEEDKKDQLLTDSNNNINVGQGTESSPITLNTSSKHLPHDEEQNHKYGTTTTISSKYDDNNETNYKVISPSGNNITTTNVTSNYNLYQESTIHDFNTSQQEHIPTSYTKGILLQCLSKYCYCCCRLFSNNNEPNKILVTIANFHPKHLLKQFLSSMIYELSKFTKPKIAIPFLFNQCSAIFYYKLIATSALTNVAYCQAMSMAIEGIVSYLLGERMSHPMRGFGGAAIVTLGVGICLLSDEIELLVFGGDVDDKDGNQYYGQGNGNERQLDYTDDYDHDDHTSMVGNLWQESSDTSLFEISPFVFWYAICGVLHWLLRFLRLE